MTAPIDEQKRAEARARYAALTDRIAGIDHDIAAETDGERLATLEDRRADLVRRRDDVAREMGGAVPMYDQTPMVVRVGNLEVRVDRLERIVKPPWRVTAWRLASVIVAVFAALLFVTPTTHVILFDLYPPFGIGALVFLAVMAALLWRMGAVTLEREQ